jgi:class 3 adenylate cyclase
MDERLAAAVAGMESDRWASFALDAHGRLAWLSSEMKGFLRASSDEELGIGKPIVEAFLSPGWQGSLTEESGFYLFLDVLASRDSIGVSLEDVHLDDAMTAFVKEVPAAPPREVITGMIDYVPVGGRAYPVSYLLVPLRTAGGELIGSIFVSYIGIRASLLARLGRGDESMYERMAKVAEPARHQTAIVFADLESSGELSRALPTAAYFDLIRSLTAAFDDVISDRGGIIGKHVGDGWTGFVLAADAGGSSAAAAAAVETVRQLQDEAAQAARSLAETLGREFPLRINAGVHWGAGVYLGQLVPNGRLEVTALGDEVNECARIQDCARSGTVLASKPLMELLDADDAKRLGLDPSRLVYQPLASMDTATEKTRRDAAAVAVTAVPRPAG